MIQFRQVSFHYNLLFQGHSEKQKEEQLIKAEPEMNDSAGLGQAEQRQQYSNSPTIDQLTLTIEQGEYVAVVGSNGSGKSTLAKLMNGILLPTEGEVLIEGYSTKAAEHLYQIRQTVGLVFQNPENQMVATTVFDDIVFGLENIGFPPAQMLERVEEVLHKVGMWAYRDTEPHHLSGGQKQRVAIAGVLAMRPKIILFDEATSMLDPQGRRELLSIMRELHQEGLTIIHITHDMDEALEASRVLVMQEGRISKDGRPAEIFQDRDGLEQQELHSPFIYEAIHCLRQRGVSVPYTIQTEKELVAYLWTLA